MVKVATALLLGCLAAHAVRAEMIITDLPGDFYIGTFEFRDQYGVFRIELVGPSYVLEERDNYFRLWGVTVTDQEGVLSLIDQPVTCWERGVVHSDSTGRLQIADCRIGDARLDQLSGRVSLNELAVDAGFATEICAETGGRFGHCRR